ncbi:MULTISPECIES: MBL fold metallo-hydrolase [Rhodopseudomonas]|uniref:Zn-dependent hydrolase n=1 Tax=Rhodopseudomonas palustris TaxID=1076 RepID=A0A0D7F4Z8_RHOPL|nr:MULTISPECIES: MBL fold metallo-hydrolase [Rhodopseudomonas]KIZ47870.1 Zn-dependent hydrolase [Rhodopseudomonas palustris]MDF3812573.1 MBL fold metallo-hydrolase [Rhodopseudomonas sp. BAL398]WOK17678.1 MBL fold metallo-hydrolase [Rhodopseudomonas sp. BAL398]
MKDRMDEGLWAWRQTENHNHMIDLQEVVPAVDGEPAVELAYFGASAFRITAPSGLTIMIDPWRNPPWGTWNWYLYDFPEVVVDIAMSTHAHFDHDAVHQLSANVILDRLIGTYQFADVKITGIADKHVSDSTHNAYDWAEMTRRLTPMKTNPPDNCRSFDNCLLVIEVAGLKILHWGDNRPNPPQSVWDKIGEVDIALLPIDGSQHVMSYAQVDEVAERLKARLVVPHHYGVWDVTTRGSTLLPPDTWVNGRADAIWTESGSVRLTPSFVKQQHNRAYCFGEHVAFEKPVPRGAGK